MSYVYRHVELVRVLDGDTVELEIDLGNKIKWRDKFRLFGIDTPEISTTDGVLVRDYLESLCSNGLAMVETHKPDKFGRWLADIHIPCDQGGTVNVNRLLVVEGHAKPYFGGKK